jgi:hypothetical protein
LALGALGIAIGLFGNARFDESPGVRTTFDLVGAAFLIAAAAVIIRGYLRRHVEGEATK